MTAAPTATLSIAYRPGPLTQEQAAELAACALSFRHFLDYWRFKDRESGQIRSFSPADLWAGQAGLVSQMEAHANVYALKAGKLGFTELECAFDGWVARFRQPNARVHLFSMGQESSRALLEIVRFGLDSLPEWMRLPVVEGEAEAATSTSLKLYAGPGDTRRIVSYPAKQNASIDQTCSHAHCDEYARWPYGSQMWQAVRSTISPTGSCHMITRGNGPNWAAKEYHKARRRELVGQDGSPFVAAFYPWHARPRAEEWRKQQEGKEASDGYIWQFAPETWQQALQGDSTYVYPMWENPPGRHVIPAHPCDLEDNRRLVITIDPGGTDPTALGLYGERSSGRVHKYAEWFKAGGASDDDIERVIVEWEHEAGRRIRVGVPKDEPTLYYTLQAHGFAVFWCSTDRDEGIRLVRQRLTTNGYTVHDGCTETIVEYEDYRVVSVTDATTKVVYAGDRPVKHHADCVDCDRYALMAFAQWEEEAVVSLPSGRRVVGIRR